MKKKGVERKRRKKIGGGKCFSKIQVPARNDGKCWFCAFRLVNEMVIMIEKPIKHLKLAQMLKIFLSLRLFITLLAQDIKLNVYSEIIQLNNIEDVEIVSSTACFRVFNKIVTNVWLEYWYNWWYITKENETRNLSLIVMVLTLFNILISWETSKLFKSSAINYFLFPVLRPVMIGCKRNWGDGYPNCLIFISQVENWYVKLKPW